MNFLEIAKTRYSCRSYQPSIIENEKLMQILEAARIAPSAVNYQPWHFIVIQEPANKEKVYEAYNREWIKTAPVLIIACGYRNLSWKRADGKDFLEVDLSIAIDHITLQATELGLATCWVCNFKEAILKENLKLPENIVPVAIIPLGYPADTSDKDRHQEKRKNIIDIVSFEF
jgi:nitroreductase